MTGFTINASQKAAISRKLSILRQAIIATPDDRPRVGISLAKLLAAFPTQDQSDTPASLRVEAYADALRDAPAWAVEEGRLRVVRGQVPDLDTRFAPTPPQFAEIVRDVLAPLRRDAVDLAALEVIAANVKPPPTEAEKQRMAERLAEFRKDMGWSGRSSHQVYEDAMSGLAERNPGCQAQPSPIRQGRRTVNDAG